MLPIRKILHPTDFSAYSETAFRLACAVARDYDASLVVLHVASPSAVAYPEGLFVLPPALADPEMDDYLVRLRPASEGEGPGASATGSMAIATFSRANSSPKS